MEAYKKVTKKTTICVEMDEDEAEAIVHHLKYMEENGFVFDETPEMNLLVELNRVLRTI